MSYEVRATAPARVQMETIAAWWLANRDKAPDLFEEELARAWALLEFAPLSGPHAPGPLSGFRRLLLTKTRYHVYYTVDEDRRVVEIHAVWHTSHGSLPRL